MAFEFRERLPAGALPRDRDLSHGTHGIEETAETWTAVFERWRDAPCRSLHAIHGEADRRAEVRRHVGPSMATASTAWMAGTTRPDHPPDAGADHRAVLRRRERRQADAAVRCAGAGSRARRPAGQFRRRGRDARRNVGDGRRMDAA